MAKRSFNVHAIETRCKISFSSICNNPRWMLLFHDNVSSWEQFKSSNHAIGGGERSYYFLRYDKDGSPIIADQFGWMYLGVPLEGSNIIPPPRHVV